MRRLKLRSPVTLIAGVALFLSLAGTGIAASRYVITSVAQIKPSVVAQLRGNRGPGGRTGPQGVTGPVGAQGPKGDAGPSGPQGPNGEKGASGAPGTQGATGATGPQGPQGAPGGLSNYNVYQLVGTTPLSATTTTDLTVTVDCPTGTVPVGGGYHGLSDYEGTEVWDDDAATGSQGQPVGWRVTVQFPPEPVSQGGKVYAEVVCAGQGGS